MRILSTTDKLFRYQSSPHTMRRRICKIVFHIPIQFLQNSQFMQSRTTTLCWRDRSWNEMPILSPKMMFFHDPSVVLLSFSIKQSNHFILVLIKYPSLKILRKIAPNNSHSFMNYLWITTNETKSFFLRMCHALWYSALATLLKYVWKSSLKSK